MAEQNNETVKYPKNALIEDVAKDFLDGDKLECLIDFLAFLKNNKLIPRRSTSVAWVVKYKGKIVCHVRLLVEEKTWSSKLDNCTIKDWCITHSHFSREKWFVNYEKYFTDEEMIQFVLDRIQEPVCPRKGWTNNCQYRITLWGKEFHSVCNCQPFINTNPRGVGLERSKKLILIIKSYITDFAAANKA